MRRSALVAAILICLWSTAPGARIEETSEYTKSQTFNSAIRFLRIDSGLAITEKDPELGYLMFEYPTGAGITTTGSVEVIERERDVLVVVQIPKLPSYHESLLTRGLIKKLHDDYGDPPRREDPKPTPSEKPKDPAKESGADGPAKPSLAPLPHHRIK